MALVYYNFKFRSIIKVYRIINENYVRVMMTFLINVCAGACIKIFSAFFIYKFEITHYIFVNIYIYIFER